MAVEKPKPGPKPGRPRIPGRRTALEDPRHELFCQTYLKNGFKRSPAVQHAFGTDDGRNSDRRAKALLLLPEVKDRLRYLLEQQSRERVALDAITKDGIDGRMWAIIERCLQHQKIETPEHLRGRAFAPCSPCKKKRLADRCPSCQSNQKLIEDWAEFGGIYKFDSGGAVKALLPLGRDRGLYIDKKLVGHMEGDEIIDAMNDKEIRDLVRSLATQVGLRIVEAGSEGASGASTESRPNLHSVS